MVQMQQEQIFRFSGFTLDLAKGVLLRANEPALLRPKAQALLTHLAKNPGRVVSKTELMDTVWPSIFVTEDSLTQSIREVRKVLGDDDQRLIRTISRRGYMLAPDPEPATGERSLPVLAVLKLRNETGDEDQTPLIDGFAEEIINGVARFGTVTVLSRQSSFAIAAADRADWLKARKLIGADFLLEGVVRRSGNNYRVSINLVEAENLTQLWSDRYDAKGNAIFEVQDDIAERIIFRLIAGVEEASVRRSARKPVANLAAYELTLRAVAVLRSNSYDDFKKGTALLEAAIVKDPNYGLAHAHLAFAKVMLAGFGRASPSALDAALEIAVRAMTLDPDQPTAHRVLSFIQMYRREYSAAEHHLRNALALNPFDADSVDQMGYLLVLRGHPLEALSWLDKACRLNPIHPQWYEHDRSFALYLLGEYAEAARVIELTPILPPWMRTWLAACYAQLGHLETAHYHASRITENDPDFSAENFARRNGAAFEHDADNEHFAQGVYLALGISQETDSFQPKPPSE